MVKQLHGQALLPLGKLEHLELLCIKRLTDFFSFLKQDLFPFNT